MLPYGGQQLDEFVPPTSLETVHGCVCTVWVYASEACVCANKQESLNCDLALC